MRSNWKTLHDVYAGPAEDRAIDAREELKNIQMTDNEMASEYVSRARGLGIKCTSAGLNISKRQIVYNIEDSTANSVRSGTENSTREEAG